MPVCGLEVTQERGKSSIDGGQLIGEWLCMPPNGVEATDELCQMLVGTAQVIDDPDQVDDQNQDHNDRSGERQPGEDHERMAAALAPRTSSMAPVCSSMACEEPRISVATAMVESR